MHSTRLLKSLVTTMLLAFAGVASAGSATANLNVSASVAPNCTIATTPVAFGAYDPVVTHAGAALDATGTVEVACTKGATATITLGLGSNSTGTTRRMSDGGTEFLSYELYKQPGTTPGAACNYTGAAVWGTTGTDAFTTTAAPTKGTRIYNVCGRVAGGQDVPSGSYTDTVQATVNF